MPKRPEFMQIFTPRPGEVLLDVDLSAVEPRIITQLSQDRTMLSVYGKNANPDADIYLTTGANLSIFRDKIREYYDPNNPTKEGVKLAKKNCESERKRSKTVFLGYIYGMRAGTLAKREGLPMAEAEELISDMDKAFSGLVRFGERSRLEWANNGGYVFNACGVPMCVDRKYLKDLASRKVQSSGVMLLRHLTQTYIPRRLNAKGAWWRPFVPNYHDEFVLATKPEHVDKVTEAINEAFEELNNTLQWDVEIKHGGIAVGDSLRIRCEE